MGTSTGSLKVTLLRQHQKESLDTALLAHRQSPQFSAYSTGWGGEMGGGRGGGRGASWSVAGLKATLVLP